MTKFVILDPKGKIQAEGVTRHGAWSNLFDAINTQYDSIHAMKIMLGHRGWSSKKIMSEQPLYAPVTPSGTILDWLISSSEEEARDKLLKDAAHMPYKGKEGFSERGYTVIEVEEIP